MANLHLPDDIVLMILNCVVAKPTTQHLPHEFAVLAGVCQQWIKLALPIICSSAAIRYICVPSLESNELSWNPVVKSDIPGIMLLSGQSYVKSVFFEIDAGKRFLDLLEAI
ncbi:hypothetical protein LPJ66_004155, partial [Kickxella alabastrina]